MMVGRVTSLEAKPTALGGGGALRWPQGRFSVAAETVSSLPLSWFFAAPGLKLAQWSENAAGVLTPAELLTLRTRDDDSREPQAQEHSAGGLELPKVLA